MLAWTYVRALLETTYRFVNVLERGSQVHFIGELQALVDFPPAPKLNVEARLDLAKASEQELRGEQIFHGKGACASCHVPPYYTDHLMHNLQTDASTNPRSTTASWL